MRTTAPPDVPRHIRSFELRAGAATSTNVPAGRAAAPCDTSKAFCVLAPFSLACLRLTSSSFPSLVSAFPVRALSAPSVHHGSRSSLPRPVTDTSPLALKTQGATLAVPVRHSAGSLCTISWRLPRFTSSRATARVRRPSLTVPPVSFCPRSHCAPPTAFHDRRRPHNQRLQRTGTRLALGASRRQARASR